MKLNKKLVELLLQGTNHFEVVGQLDVYGNGKILEVNTLNKIYNEKSNYQGTTSKNIIVAETVNKDIKKIVEILNGLGYEKL